MRNSRRNSRKKTKQRKQIMILVSIIAIISIGVFVGVSNVITARAEEARQEEELRIKNEKTKELQEKINEIYNQENEKIEEAINSTVKNSKNYGIYYQDLTTGNVIAYNEDKYFTAASTIKVALVLDAADMIHKGALKEDDKVLYTSKEYEGGTGILQGNVVPGVTKIEVSKLMELAITHSDNIATHMLKKVCEDLDSYVLRITGMPRKDGANNLTAEQQGMFLKKLYDNKDNNPVYDKIIANMKNTIFHDRLDKYLPYEKVAHKIGNYGGFTHDTGIIYTKRPYSLTVFTESVGTESMAKLSQTIYNLKNENDEQIEILKENYKNDYGVDLADING